MRKNRPKKEVYILTPKGLIGGLIWDQLELYCYRFNYNAILVNKKGGEFIKVVLDKHKNTGEKT